MRPTTPRECADMNITPLIDVLLVLLVIFLAALSISKHGSGMYTNNAPIKRRS